MALITIGSDAHLEGKSGLIAEKIDSLTAGSAITKLAPCRIDTTSGLVFMATSACATQILCTSSSATYQPDYAGVAPTNYAANAPVTLYRAGTIMSAVASGLTIGQGMYISSTLGQFNGGSSVILGDQPVAVAISATDLFLLR